MVRFHPASTSPRNSMINMLGKQFITDKEASERYGYSQSWFLKARANGTGPKFVQITDNGRVLYPLVETDSWFKERMNMKS